MNNADNMEKELEQAQIRVKTVEEERDRFLAIAYNAIVLGQLDERYSKKNLLDELGCTEEEFEKIMN